MDIDIILENIKKKTWAIDEILAQATDIERNAKKLSTPEKKEIPIFPNDWSEVGIRRYLQDIEKAVNDPIRFKNKKRLEELGLKISNISEQILGDTAGIDNVVTLFKEVKIIPLVSSILIDTNLLANWIRDGIELAQSKLREVTNATPAFKRVSESIIDKKLKLELLRNSIEDIRFLTEAETIISKYQFVNSYGVKLDFKDEHELDSFKNSLDSTVNLIKQMKIEFGTGDKEIKSLINNRNLYDSINILFKAKAQNKEKKDKLLLERSMYASALKSLGENLPTAPLYLKELSADISVLKQKCKALLGNTGIQLLNYLKGDGKFPEKATLADIKKGLEMLRPFLAKSFIGGD